jgi:hypothetical protein
VNRRAGLIGLIGLLVLILGISAVMFLGSLDGCMTGNDSASCPTMAEVNGVRYDVGIERDLVGADAALISYGTVTRTNVPKQLAPDSTVYRFTNIDPGVVLAARTASCGDCALRYRLMFALPSGGEAAFPALCDFFTEAEKAIDSHCHVRIDP